MLIILCILLFPNFVYWNFIDKIDEKIEIKHWIQERKGLLWNLNNITVPRFDTEYINITKHEYKAVLLYDEKWNLWKYFVIDDKPEVVDFLYSKFWFEKIMKFLHKWASESLIEIMSYDYLKNIADYFSEWDIKKDVKYFVNIEQNIEIENTWDAQNVKTKFYMFDKNSYSDGRWDYFEPRPKLVIIDNALHYKDFYLEVDWKIYNPEIKYIYQKTMSDTNETTITFLPYFEVEVLLKKWINQLKTRYDIVDTMSIKDWYFVDNRRGFNIRLNALNWYKYVRITEENLWKYIEDK